MTHPSIRSIPRLMVVALLAWGAGVARARAQDAPPATASPAGASSASEARDPALFPEHPLGGYTLEIKPMIWAPGLRGNIELPSSSRVDVEDLNADETQIAPAGSALLRAGKWTIGFRGFGFSLDEEASSRAAFTLGGAGVAPGERTQTDIDFYSFDLAAEYELPTVIDNAADEVRLAFGVLGGARISSLDMEVRSAGAGAQSDNTWAMPIVGGRLTLDLPHRLGLWVRGDIGGFPGSDGAFTWDITVGFFWMPLENVGLEIGFRHLDSNLQDGDGPGGMEFDASLAGLYGALVFRF